MSIKNSFEYKRKISSVQPGKMFVWWWAANRIKLSVENPQGKQNKKRKEEKGRHTLASVECTYVWHALSKQLICVFQPFFQQFRY
jgi:hypothetical protein